MTAGRPALVKERAQLASGLRTDNWGDGEAGWGALEAEAGLDAGARQACWFDSLPLDHWCPPEAETLAEDRCGRCPAGGQRGDVRGRSCSGRRPACRAAAAAGQSRARAV